jgi:hypothetical protein
MNIKDSLIFVGIVLVILSFGVITGVGTYYIGMYLMDRYDYNAWQFYTWGSGISLSIISTVIVLRIVKMTHGEK